MQLKRCPFSTFPSSPLKNFFGCCKIVENLNLKKTFVKNAKFVAKKPVVNNLRAKLQL